MRRLLLAACAILLALMRPQAARASCAVPANAIEAENCLPGNPPSEWDLNPKAGNATIQGFATDISYNHGQTAQFKIKTDAPSYRLDIYRLGYYGGQGARKVATVFPDDLPDQPPCLTQPSSGLIDCGNWSVTASWPIPGNAVSGIYVAKIIRGDNNAASHIVFIVRNDGGNESILFQTADTTWQAYNPWGGNSLYIGGPDPAGRGYKVSYNRPFTVRVAYPTSVFNQEYPIVRWLEANGYNVAYFTNIDSDRRGSAIQDHAVFLSAGHQEYWSLNIRNNIEAARNAGVHMAFLSSVTGLWKTRWEPSLDGSGAPRTMVCYKESMGTRLDPQDPPVWTGLWRDNPPGPDDASRPENALTGQSYAVDALRNDALVVPGQYAGLPIWRNTSVANLGPGDSAVFPQTLGFEWDEDTQNSVRPPGLIQMSESTYVVPKRLVGNAYQVDAAATHHLTFYTHPSGAQVFGSGTMQWGWGLDSHHDGGSGLAPQLALQQATVNILGDMGVQPGSIQPGLVPTAPDLEPPVSIVTAPPDGGRVFVGTTAQILGTASDSGGGNVQGVEVTTDGGATWHPAQGQGVWSYAWLVSGAGQAVLQSRATDSSGNVEAPMSTRTVTVVDSTPVIAGLDPVSAVVGGPGFSLRVTGASFVPEDVVRLNAANRPTTFVDSGTLVAAITAADIGFVRIASVTVMAPGNRLSNPWPFTVRLPNPVPALAPPQPIVVGSGGAAFTLEMMGAGFVPESVIAWNGSARPTVYVSPTRLQAAIRPEDIASPGMASVTVTNPPPGGGVSQPYLVQIRPGQIVSAEVRPYPNPWREDTHRGLPLRFAGLSSESKVKIFTVSGRLVSTLSAAGSEALWNLTDNDGEKVASGYYFYLIEGGENDESRGMVAVLR